MEKARGEIFSQATLLWNIMTKQGGGRMQVWGSVQVNLYIFTEGIMNSAF